MSKSIYNGMVAQFTHTTETLTQFNDDPHLNLKIDTSQMRTHRLPEDDEGMTDENQIPSRMDKSLQDLINGVTPENPEGVSQIVSIRLDNIVVEKLKAYGKPIELGHQALIRELIENFVKTIK